MLIVVVRPTKRGKFVAYLGERQISRPTFTPFLAAARTLVDLGYDPATKIVMCHYGSDTEALVSTIGKAAALTVEEMPSGLTFRPFKPFNRAKVHGSIDQGCVKT